MENNKNAATVNDGFKHNKSFGYFSIPFTINKSKYKALTKHIDTIADKTIEKPSADNKNNSNSSQINNPQSTACSTNKPQNDKTIVNNSPDNSATNTATAKTPKDDSNKNKKASTSNTRFDSCRYIFSYITQIFKSNNYYKIDIEALKKEMNNKDIFDKLFPLKSTEPAIRFPAKCEEISIFILDKCKGYLIFKIDYNNMTLEDIEPFSYYFRHIVNSTKNNSTFAEIACFILGVRKFESFERTKEDLTTPFYYLHLPQTYICDVLQLVCNKMDYTDEMKNAHYVTLGRGYQTAESTINDYIEKSKYDMLFSPRPNVTWIGNPSTLTCLIKADDDSTKHSTSNLQNDYLCLFLTLLNQRHTLLSFMTDMVRYKNDSGKLLKIQDKLNAFKLAESFKTVSNEYAYQNIYDRMYAILDIDTLMADINDISTHAAEQKENNIEKLFKIFTVAASIETLYNIFSVLVPLIFSYIVNDQRPDNFFTEIGTLSGCVASVIILAIIFTIAPKIIKRK